MKITEDLTPVNHTVNGMKQVRGIVIHSMAGTYAGSRSWFKNPNSSASAHYLISKKGEILRMVEEKDMAWHAGVYDEPIPDYLRPNPNFYTIGIELEDENNKNWVYPEAQIKALQELVADLKARYNLKFSNIFLHRKLNPSRRSDPIGAYNESWLGDPDSGTINPMDPDKESGIKNLDNYRKERKEGPGGNYEGFVDAVIGSDKRIKTVELDAQNAVKKAAEAETKAGNLKTSLDIKTEAFESLKKQLEIAENRIIELEGKEGPVIVKEWEPKTQIGRIVLSVAKWADGK